MAGEDDTQRRHDPGDAVPPGVAVEQPAPLSEADRKAREKLERLTRDRPAQS